MTMPEKIWVTGRYVCFGGEEYRNVDGSLSCVSEENGHTSYTLTSIMDTRIAELEAEVERLREVIKKHCECVYCCNKCGHSEPFCTDDKCEALNGDSHDA